MLIHNVRLVTWGLTNEVLDGRAVLLEKGRIAEIGQEARMLKRHARAERLDGGGQLLMPGAICAHTHFYGAFARGMAIPGRAPRDFPDILRKLWWPLDKSLTADDIRASAAGEVADDARSFLRRDVQVDDVRRAHRARKGEARGRCADRDDRIRAT